jgi:2-succinyl-5-enolpyruvyl-6-hydroxy-3-cyclohexene-1-carboxylate synthase
MASKKGITVTVIILVAITAASFLFWIIPQENPPTLVVSDYENYLDGVKKIHEVLQESIEIEFQNLLNEKTSTDEYIAITEVTSTQVTAQISEFITSKPPEEWQDSYISYMEALKKFNAYIIETKVAANMLKEGQIDTEIIQKIESLKSESQELINKSNELRP